MAKDIIVAIDGLSSSGKSTLAKQLASSLQYRYIDSGAFYRAVTLYLLRHKVDWHNADVLAKALKNIDLDFSHEGGYSRIFLNSVNVESEIRSMEVSGAVSEVSRIPEVRSFLVKKLRSYGQQKRIVMDGRDIGTVVFPHAELKVFMTADEKTRSGRRFNEMKSKGIQVTEQEISRNLSGRDRIDSTRSTAPLKKADDAIVLDNTHLSLHEQFEKVLKMAQRKIDGD